MRFYLSSLSGHKAIVQLGTCVIKLIIHQISSMGICKTNTTISCLTLCFLFLALWMRKVKEGLLFCCEPCSGAFSPQEHLVMYEPTLLKTIYFKALANVFRIHRKTYDKSQFFDQ